MRPIPIGATGIFTLRVMPNHLANQFKDAILPQVFATPMMVTIMENAALNAIRDYLEPGESAVGTVVNVRHLAATPVGHQVTATATVTQGRRPAHRVRRLGPRRDRGNRHRHARANAGRHGAARQQAGGEEAAVRSATRWQCDIGEKTQHA
jgi:fluoroacetyl-CoA thioesterase